MATGLEALGAASAVIQLVSFSTSVISKAIDVYQGRPLSDGSVEEYAEQLQNAVAQVELCCQGANMQHSVHERKITEIAKKCQKSARELQGEVSSLSSTRQSGKAWNALSSAIKARYHQNKLRDLEGTLRKQKEVLETQLLAYICTQTQAVALTQKKEFQALSIHVQHLVGQIAAGNTNLESCVQAEHAETRAHLAKEMRDTGGKVTSEIATASQRTRFLDSLKSDRMNQRYNDITDPEAATYQRIFAAYDEACDDLSEPIRTQMELTSNHSDLADIDRGLDQLASWLQTSDPLFWISGKPGSGKSTFMKTVVNSSSVKMLLERWDPRAEIISHFFWKFGSEPQSSVKGLLCTLSYQILLRHKDLLTSIPNFQDSIISKSSYYDWSLGEAKNLLLHLLNSSDKYFCIFIDGLDEVNDEEGSEAILNIISTLPEQQHVKVCVSSRPEHQLQLGLTALHASSIKMEWFTACDMQLYAEKELEPLKSSRMIHPTDYTKLVSRLVEKASGVFLWLCLATRSIKDGAKNGDSSPELYSRLEQLPGQLEDLYTDMWNRLNHNMSIYKEVAASIFRCVIEAHGLMSLIYGGRVTFLRLIFPTTVSVGYAVDQDFAKKFAQAAENPVALDPLVLCKRIEDMIMIRSAGLLEVERSALPSEMDIPSGLELSECERMIRFIHRTAYEFFVSTEAGKAILKHSKSTSLDLRIKMLDSSVCLAQLVSTKGTYFVDCVMLVLQVCQAIKRYDSDLTKKAQYEQHVIAIFTRLEKVYNYGYAKIGKIHPVEFGYSSFLGLTAQLRCFDDFTASHAKKIASSTAVEDIWRAVWNRNFPPTEDDLTSSMSLIKDTSTFNSNWHHNCDYAPNIYDKDAPIIWTHTPFTRLLAEGLSLVTWIDAVSKLGEKPISETALSTFLDLLLNAASNLTNWDDHVIIISQYFPTKRAFLAIPRVSNLDIYITLCQATQDEPIPENPDLGWVFYHQVPIRFIFQKVVRDLTPRVGIPSSLTDKLDEILQSRQDLSPWTQLLIRLKGHEAVTCYQTVSKARFNVFNSMLFTRSSCGDLFPVELEEEISSLIRDPIATKVMPLQLAFDSLAQLNHSLCVNAHAEMPRDFESALVFSMERRTLIKHH